MFIATIEVTLQQSLQTMEFADVVLEEYAGLEECAKQRAIFKRQEEDWKKEKKLVKDAKKATTREEEKKLKVTAKAIEKETQKLKGNETIATTPKFLCCQ